MRSLFAALLFAVSASCAEPFDPTAWRTEIVTMCTVEIGGAPPTCQTMRCEVRGTRPYVRPGETFRVVGDNEREYRNCVPIV